MPNRTRLCTAAAVAALLTAGPLSLSAQAADTRSAPSATAAQQSRAEVRVNSFFRDYRQAVLHKGGSTPAQVRARYLTPDLNKRLDAWALKHDADPVFQAQNVPASWKTRYEGSGAGHATVVLTEHWSGGRSQDVWYAVRLSDLTVNDLKAPPS
ncbi:hypothetical protein ACH427_10895 [Streptomyces sp. NPDC020379]|uniref:hypothetical protein n=1 Tax=Streptomyces sp. NPDC020379 TaxID=3365071 RepID=UPI00379C1D27